MEVRVSEWGTFLATRDKGRELREEVERRLRELAPGEALILDFDGVHAATPSFVDELVGKLIAARAAGEHDEVGFLLANVNDEVRETVELVAERRGAAVAMLEGLDVRVLAAERWLIDTVAGAVRLERFRAAELAELLNLSAQAANNRLKAAVVSGAVSRERSVPTGGGKEFIYRVAVPIHA